MRVLTVVNQKGGVGKTTTVLNIATALALQDYQVLIIDLDPQGNASTGIDIARAQRTPGTYSLLIEELDPVTVMTRTQIPNLFIVAADGDLAAAEMDLVGVKRREFRLKDALARVNGIDWVLIDCPPSLGLLTVNGLVAASSILVPLQCEFFALEGLSHLVHTIDRVQHSFNQAAQLDGIVLTMFDRRNNLSEQVAADARNFFGARVYDTVIPRNVRVSEAPSHGVPVILYDPRSAGANAYTQLTSELLRRNTHKLRSA